MFIIYNMSKKIISILLLTIIILSVYFYRSFRWIDPDLEKGPISSEQAADYVSPNPEESAGQENVEDNTKPDVINSAGGNIFVLPIDSALNRVAKKPFGIKVSPQDSPVQPEKFSGYHTGVDFEILPGEEDVDVSVFAICDGSLVYKNYVNGYGGVLIEKCQLNEQDITVLYGHLRLSSITKNIGEGIESGETLAVLGKGFSSETSGERKHLHLGIHKGADINFLGYITGEEELKNWIDVLIHLKS